MNLKAYREAHGITQERCAADLGLAHKGRVSELEREKDPKRPSVGLALAIEKWSGGQVPARELNPDVALVEEHLGRTGEAA